jgi:hypothetical protein
MSEQRRRTITIASGILLLFLVALTRVLIESRAELREGQAALTRGDTSEGVRRLRRAAHWYAPGSPWCAEAYASLERVATETEAQGRNEQALSAWRAIRASALATRWLVVPERARLERANRHIAALMAELPPPPEDRAKDRNRLREEHLALLQQDHAPDPAWIVVMGVALVTWVLGLYRALRYGWTEDDRPEKRTLLLSLCAVFGGLALMLFAISRA